MKLDLVVPHYKEPWSVCKYLFDSLAVQRGINFDDIRVILVNDGPDILMGSMERAIYTLCGYPFTVDHIVKEHAGVSAARNAGLMASDADYVMFCDCDDGFLNNYAIYTIFASAHDSPNFIISNFLEETYDAEKNWAVVLHDQDLTFMHGKIYRRQFLIDNELFFDERMHLHEDGYYNLLTHCVASHNGDVRKISTAIYIWKWNGDSVVRRNSKDFVIRTYDQLMLTRIGLCEQLQKRGYDEDFQTAVCMTVLNSYYDFQKAGWLAARNDKNRKAAEKEFRKFWMEFKGTFNEQTYEKIADVAKVARANACKHGLLMEKESLKEFTKRIEYEVK